MKNGELHVLEGKFERKATEQERLTVAIALQHSDAWVNTWAAPEMLKSIIANTLAGRPLKAENIEVLTTVILGKLYKAKELQL